MNEYLWRVSVSPKHAFDKKPKPVYCVARDKDSAREYVERHLRGENKTGIVSKLGVALGAKMFHGN